MARICWWRQKQRTRTHTDLNTQNRTFDDKTEPSTCSIICSVLRSKCVAYSPTLPSAGRRCACERRARQPAPRARTTRLEGRRIILKRETLTRQFPGVTRSRRTGPCCAPSAASQTCRRAPANMAAPPRSDDERTSDDRRRRCLFAHRFE